ncbi:MAG: LapA family protein [Rhodobacteraceae bacterium]|nr:LapA family protein [Paracoccaceae bacterium]
MIRFIKNVILASVAIVLVPISVANRHAISISLNPFNPQDPNLTLTDVPLFWVIFAALGVGILLGGFNAWAKQGKWRKEARQKRQEARKWHHEADQLRTLSEQEKLSGTTSSDAGSNRSTG